MKNPNEFFRVMGLVFAVLGAYFTLNLLVKISSGEILYINNADISGIPRLIIGIICLLIYKKQSKIRGNTELIKTKFISFILVLLALDLFRFDVSFIFTSPTNLSFYLSATYSIIMTVITLVYIYKLNYLKKDILKWTNVAFGLSLVVFFYMGISGRLEDTTSLLYPPFLLTLVMGILLWVLFYRHLSKAINSKRIVLAN